MVGFLVFTLAAAGLIIGFLYNINFGEIQNTVADIITPKEDFSRLEKVNYLGLIKKMQTCNTKCFEDDENIACGNLLLTNEFIIEPQLTTGLDKTWFETKFVEINYCTDCNLDLTGVIMPNTVVNLTCNNIDYHITITGN